MRFDVISGQWRIEIILLTNFLSPRLLHNNYIINQRKKHRLDVIPSSCRSLIVFHLMSIQQLVQLLFIHLSKLDCRTLSGHSYSHKSQAHISPPYYFGKDQSKKQGFPKFSSLDNHLLTRKIKHENSANSVFQVARDETAVSLLTSGIPKLQAACRGIMRNIFAKEIDADCWLG